MLLMSYVLCIVSSDCEYTVLGISRLSVCVGLWLWFGEISSQCFIWKPPETGKYRLESAARSQIRDGQSRGTETLRTGECVSLSDSDSTAQHSEVNSPM
jgi:hypothetical protein